MSSNSMAFGLYRPMVAATPRAERPAAQPARSRRTLARRFLMSMLATAERSPLMGIYVASNGDRA
ncbi:MAG: hypothetical protein GX657_00535 [Chloroflexi bacterium]|nr:hypothetical protein [Chloroflexota bacterium]